MMIPLSLIEQAHESGLCIVPPAQDGSKKPFPPGRDSGWRKYQTDRPELTLLKSWYDPRNGLTGIGIVTGRVSGNLEALDFDTKAGWDAYREMAEHCGVAPLIERIWNGYGELSPRGAHLLYRCSVIAGNTKLARDETGKAFIETRGEGGYLVIAPSNGRVHPSGGEYSVASGSLVGIQSISERERKDLWELARSMDRVQRPIDQREKSVLSVPESGRPGEDFNREASWPSILEPLGWTRLFERSGVTYWRRPGKKTGISATSGYAGTDLFYVFTSSTPLDNDRAYSKFGVFAALQHGGDFRAAASALGKNGYGTPPLRNKPQPSTRPIPPETQPIPPNDRKRPEEGGKPRPPLIALADYIARPRAAHYLIKGVIPAVGLGQLFGDSNVGKSFLAIDIGCHIALGMAWRGHKVKQTGVVYIAAEGLAGLQARFYAWCQQTGEIPDRFWIREHPVGLTVPGSANALADEIDALPFPVGLVILDTFAGNFGIGSENAAEDMAAALVGMKALGRGRMILNVHHTGHADKTRGRGHSSLFAAIDIEMLVAKQEREGLIAVSHTKARDFDRMTPLSFRIDPVGLPWADDDGDPINSAMAVPAEPVEAAPKTRIPSPKEQRALDLLRALCCQSVAGSPPKVKLLDWYRGMDFETDRGHRARIRKGLENKGFIYCDNGYVYFSKT